MANAQLQMFIETAIERGASDLFLVADEPPSYRVQGQIQRADSDPLDEQTIESIAVATIGTDRVMQVGARVGVAYAAVQLTEVLHCAVSVARSAGRLSIWARPMSSFTFQVQQLRVPDPLVEAMKGPGGGLVLVTGRAGSGKTTTCYALLEHLNAMRDVHIVICEYYCEYVFEPKRALVQQRQIGTDAPDMEQAIHSALVQDADVLFVGEIRDERILAACLAAPESGRLMLTQLHQPSPEAAIRQVIALQAPEARAATRRLLARHLRAVLAQTLLPRADGRGRVPAYGVLVPDEIMREAILAGRDPMERTAPLPEGSRTLAEDIERLLREGLVTQQAARAARESIMTDGV